MRWILAIAFVLVVAAASAMQTPRETSLSFRAVCEGNGGKYAANSSGARCYTEQCYRDGDCGHWAAPVNWTNRVAPGDPVSKLVFWLGQPDRRDGEDLLWPYGKGGDELFRAIISDGRLVALKDETTQAPLRYVRK